MKERGGGDGGLRQRLERGKGSERVDQGMGGIHEGGFVEGRG